MQYEHKHYAELRSIKNLGDLEQDDEADMQLQKEHEEREILRHNIKQELALLSKQKDSDKGRKTSLENELERIRLRDDDKITEFVQAGTECRKLFGRMLK